MECRYSVELLRNCFSVGFLKCHLKNVLQFFKNIFKVSIFMSADKLGNLVSSFSIRRLMF